MKQLQINQEDIVETPLAGVAALLKPVVFYEGDMYCCLLGPDPQAGVFGCGSTPEDAVENWDCHLQEHLSTADADDEVVQHVKSVIAANKPISKNVQEFYDQFRPVKK